MADASDSKSDVGNHVWVQVPSPAWCFFEGSLDFTGLPDFFIHRFDGTFGTIRTI